MSAIFQQTITALEQELDALDQRRGELARAIDTLRPLASGEEETPHPRRRSTRHTPKAKKQKRAKKRTDGRTDGRSKPRAGEDRRRL
jgi:cell division protein FtsB